MKANYHTHSPRCKHALGDSIFEYAAKAYDAGMEILGLSDHAPCPDFDWMYRMQYEELEDYLADVDKIRSDYAGKMQIYKGVEIEYMPQYMHLQIPQTASASACNYARHPWSGSFSGGNYYEYLLEHYKLDYLLLGEHIFMDGQDKIYSIYELAGPEDILVYADNCVEAMKTGYFKILAHPDLYCCNNPLVWGYAHDKACDMIIDTAIQTGVILEFNANGLRRGIQQFPDGDRYPYPDDRFWQKVATSEAKVVIGSDSHSPLEIIDWATDLAEKKLEELGIKPIETIF